MIIFCHTGDNFLSSLRKCLIILFDIKVQSKKYLSLSTSKKVQSIIQEIASYEQ